MKPLLLLSLIMTSTIGVGAIFAKKVTVGPEERPAVLRLPPRYNEGRAYPLVLLLHGRGNSAQLTDLYLGLSRVQRKDFLLLLPDGLPRSSDGQRVWNATAECCADRAEDVDDSGYLINLVSEVKSNFAVDSDQVFVIGHSNGGFMAYRLACDTEGMFRGVISIAGSTFAESASCNTQTPINVLQIHGELDNTVPYDGKGKRYPSAPETVARWAERNQCTKISERELSLNLRLLTAEPGNNENGDLAIIGNLFKLSIKPDTNEKIYEECNDDTRVGLWTIPDANHAPVFIGRNSIRQALEFVGMKDISIKN